MVEQHAAMRFAWLQKTQKPQQQVITTGTDRLLLVGYNVVWWTPIGLAPLGLVSYPVASLAFLLITALRAVINAYRINVLPVDKAIRFPLRSP